ncbi:MAG: class I mannose-6-phosphate isomerase [Vallitaleaceae bacterium]|nr:class I mannose-6-phosphate isomerase [Vallitaleaceae bacterium]
MKFKPVYKELVWGGSKLNSYFNRVISSDHIGESWDVVSHKKGMSIIENGPLAGSNLQNIFVNYKEELIGFGFESHTKFPLLVKIIDANQKLSVQVHPGDDYAFIHEDGELGKTEMWYIIDAKEDAKLVVGLKDGVTKADFKAAIETGKTERMLNYLAVKKGDVIDIQAGLVHAICEGVMLAEIQENSDTTYRIYDWGRVGLDGEQRQLHVGKSLDVIDFSGNMPTEIVKGRSVYNDNTSITRYISNQYFEVDIIDVNDLYMTDTKNSMHIYILIEGHIIIKSGGYQLLLNPGDSVLVPACVMSPDLLGKGVLLRSFLPMQPREL